MKKNLTGILFLIWAGALVAAFYVVQKPNFFFLEGLINTIWTILVAMLLLFNAYGIGRRILKLIKFNTTELTESLLFSLGIGLGGLGLLGLGASTLQLSRAGFLTVFQIVLGLFFFLTKDHKYLLSETHQFVIHFRALFSQYSIATKTAILLPILFSFLLTLTPPFEAFDALSYHLALPEKLLQFGGLHAMDVPPFWYPNITDYTYLWALGMGAERAAQMLHFGWAVISVSLLWWWATQVWEKGIAKKALLLIASISSLPIVSSWAYADMALVFYAVAALYALTFFKSTHKSFWLSSTGIMAGFAMSVKYTSFTLPLACGLLILFSHRYKESFRSTLLFSTTALLVALPWYLRNMLVMNNPFYPFIFNGLYWDSFRAEWYETAGTGIGWDLLEIISIPLNMILGHREISLIDGRIGPLFLIILPVTLWTFIKRPRQDSAQNWSLKTIGLFTALSFLAWTYGVINSAVLWQVRFFLPALILLAIPTALGWDYISKFNTPKLHISYLLNVIVAVVIGLSLLDTGLFVFARNPLAVALGTQSRERYIERVNPSYAAILKIVDELPVNANVYSLYEPRTYGLPRSTQSDLGLYNFAHDLHLHKTTDRIIQNWKQQGYTHILIYERGADITLSSEQSTENSVRQDALNDVRSKLSLVDQTPDKGYSIYKIP